MIFFPGLLTACKLCGFKSCSKLNVQRHTLKKHGFVCQQCEFETKSKLEFRQHRKIHPILLQPKHCTIEGCEFMGLKKERINHMKTIHGIAPDLRKCQRY